MKSSNLACCCIGTARSTAASQRLRRQGTLSRLHKELRNVDRKRPGKAVENIDGRVFLPPLKTADVGVVHSCVEGEPFLREALPPPDAPQILGHQRAFLHGAKAAMSRVMPSSFHPLAQP